MSALPSYFIDFLSRIRLQENHIQDCKTGHKTLRERLYGYEGLKGVIVSTFLQGSYRRATAVKPHNDDRADVDVVVVTSLDQHQYSNPNDAIKLFISFVEKYYKDKYVVNGRSIGIELSYVDLDLVITSAPSEVNKIQLSEFAANDYDLETISEMVQKGTMKETIWKTEKLYIPDREAKLWTPTNPIEQLHWTCEKNSKCNRHYVNVVKAIKWWHRINDRLPNYPKGYPLEHLVGLCCPDSISSVAEGVTLSLENIVNQYSWYASSKTSPILPDHGVPEHNVYKRVSGDDFAKFYEQVVIAAKIAREAFDSEQISDSAVLWRKLFGDEFPLPPNQNSGVSGGYSPREEKTTVNSGGRFA